MTKKKQILAKNFSPVAPSDAPPLIENIFTHALVTGGTGSGKTRSVILPLLEQCLRENASNPALKPALFITDIKGDIFPALRLLCEETGRTADLIDLHVGGQSSCNLFSFLCEDPDTGADILYRSAMAAGSKKENTMAGDNIYWERGAITYLSSVLHWLKRLKASPDPDVLHSIFTGKIDSDWKFPDRLVISWEKRERVMRALGSSPKVESRILASKLSMVYQYYKLDPKTHAIFSSIIDQIVHVLSHDILRLVLSPHPNFSETDWLREGKIVVVRFPFDLHPSASDSATRLLKMSFFRRALSRWQGDLSAVERPCYFLLDEAQRFITGDTESGDQFFVDRCRSAKVGCIYSTQSINSVEAILGQTHLNTFLALMTARFFGRTLDMPTAAVASKIMGPIDRIEGYGGEGLVQVSDPDPDVPPQPVRLSVNSREELSPSDLAALRPGEFFISQGQHRSFRHLPQWRPEHQAQISSPLLPPVQTFAQMDETSEIFLETGEIPPDDFDEAK